MGTDPDHVVPRSRGGSDRLENILWLCRLHHRRKDMPYAKGRLLITADGQGGFNWKLVRKANKHTAQEEVIAHGSTPAISRLSMQT